MPGPLSTALIFLTTLFVDTIIMSALKWGNWDTETKKCTPDNIARKKSQDSKTIFWRDKVGKKVET